MPQYTQTALKNYIWDTVLDSQVGSQVDYLSAINAGVKRAYMENDFRSSKRLSSIINLFDDVYDYACPIDLKDEAIVDIIPQVNRSPNFQANLVDAADFDRRKSFQKNLVAFNDHDFIRKLRVAVTADTLSLVISNFDTLSSGSLQNWTAVGNAVNIRTDNSNYVEGNGSIEFDIIDSGGGIAGVQNTAINVFDLTQYIQQGSLFTYAYLSNISSVQSFSIVITDNQGYTMTITVTQTNEQSSFYIGWQLLNFQIASAVFSNTAFNPEECSQVSLYFTYSATKTGQTQFRFDILMAANGTLNNVLYYTKYPWQTSGGSYQIESTSTTDFLNCDDDELPVIVSACRAEADRRLRDWNALEIDGAQYKEDKQSYKLKYPSERLQKGSTAYDWESQLNFNTDLDVIIEEPSEQFDQEID